MYSGVHTRICVLSGVIPVQITTPTGFGSLSTLDRIRSGTLAFIYSGTQNVLYPRLAIGRHTVRSSYNL